MTNVNTQDIRTVQDREGISKLYTDTYRTRMPLYNDYVFHRVYGSDTEESRAALVGLLNIILERKADPIRSIEIKNPIDLGDWILDKDTTMDIKAQTDSGEILTIEMQVSHLKDYRCRAMFYGGRLVNSSLQSGDPHDTMSLALRLASEALTEQMQDRCPSEGNRRAERRRRSRSASGPMQKSIVVSIIQNKLFSKEIGCHSIFDVREQKTGHRLCDRLEFHFLELGKVDPNKPIEEMTSIEKLAVYLRYADDADYKDSVQKICASEEGIIMAENLYRKATKEEREAAWAECRMMYQHDQASMREHAHAEGRAEGAAQEKREIAKGMKAKGLETAMIAEITGLTPEEIAEL